MNIKGLIKAMIDYLVIFYNTLEKEKKVSVVNIN